MQIVIEVPDGIYDFLKEHTDRQFPYATEWLRQGKPLPKGHGRLIDADALKKEAVTCPTVGNAETRLLDIGDVEHAPTIIEADEEVDE